jgi:hypothetical protein
MLVIAALIVLLAAAGAWALLGQGGGESGSGAGKAGGQQDKAAGAQKEAKQEPAQEAGGADEKPSEDANPPGAAPQENQAPAPPLADAQQTVYRLYYEMSFNNVNGTWAMLSPRLQEEIGSPQQWERQEDINTFTFMRFTSYPEAREAGDEAEVTFEVRLDHTWGSESLSGTWVCVNEDGKWKLDRLENENRTPV